MNISIGEGWLILFLLGAYHGINPGMGWLFAVARGMQEKKTSAVLRTLPPIALGHGLAIALALALAAALEIVIPLNILQALVALFLIGLGIYLLLRNRHPRWGGMQVGFRDLTIWSFLMASAHGAGLMLLPVVLSMPVQHTTASHTGMASHLLHAGTGPMAANPYLGAVIVHTAGYFLVIAVVAVIVYRYLGLYLLRKAWINLDLVWAGALIMTGLIASLPLLAGFAP